MLEIELRPPATEAERAALAAGLAAADVGSPPGGAAYLSAWRLTGLAEGVAREPHAATGYALSPRSSLGAARA